MVDKETTVIWMDHFFKQYCEIENFKEITDNVKVPLYGVANGKLGSLDYFLVYYLEDRDYDVQELDEIHQRDRKYVNSLYKIPKAFRAKIPNIVTIFIKHSPFSEEEKAYARKKTATMIGGEVHSAFLVDMSTLTAYGQGVSYVRTNAGGLTMMSAFRDIDPQNRAFRYMKTLMKYLQKIPQK